MTPLHLSSSVDQLKVTCPYLECPSHEYPIEATSTTSVLKGKGRFEENLPQSHDEDQTPCICRLSGFRSQQRSWGLLQLRRMTPRMETIRPTV
ncbi:hypothetical protein VNO77_08232 [Canavalia gladiata]|uniref:Uncharacterized protein n=1 Tax=Canavalia gladiata TaxID=3824 RepID=A0AAN9MF05_CANGL